MVWKHCRLILSPSQLPRAGEKTHPSGRINVNKKIMAANDFATGAADRLSVKIINTVYLMVALTIKPFLIRILRFLRKLFIPYLRKWI